MEICRMVAGRTSNRNNPWRIVRMLFLISLAGCNLTDPDIPCDYTSFRSISLLSLPTCTIEVIEASGNSAKLQIFLAREETTAFTSLRLCYSRQNMFPDITCIVQDITSLFSEGKDTVEITLENLSYSSDYACRIYMANQREESYSDVIHIVTQPSASVLYWEKVGELPTVRDIYVTAFNIGKRAFLLSGQSHTSYPDTPKNPILWEYQHSSNTWEKLTVAPFEARVYVTHFVTGNQLYIGIMHNGNFDSNAWWCYDLVSNEWTRKKDFIVPVSYVMASFSMGDKGYIIASAGSTEPILYVYDPLADSWKIKGIFPGVNLKAVTSFVYKDYAYILGGYLDIYRKLPMTNDLWVYDSDKNLWNKKNGFLGGDRAEVISISTAMGIFTGFGKYHGTYGPTDTYDWWRYLPETDTWRVCSSYIYWPLLYFSPRFAFELDGDIYVGSGPSGLWKYSEKGESK